MAKDQSPGLRRGWRRETEAQKGATREDRAFFACRLGVKPVRANRKGAAQGRIDWFNG